MSRVKQSPVPIALPAQVGVFVIGAGFGGLGLAIKLAQAGEDDFLLVDRGNEVGGTWRDNTYPGLPATCRPSCTQFSCALNPDWSRSFSPQAEIQDYLREVGNDSGVLDRFRFGVNFENASWDEQAAVWRIETSAGSVTANVRCSRRVRCRLRRCSSTTNLPRPQLSRRPT